MTATPDLPTGPAFADDEALLPAIAQDAATGRVLMLAYMNRQAYEETLRTGRAVYYSRSRKGLWRKGDTSGHHQQVRRVLVDCDRDTILLEVEQLGPGACHNGYESCFYREADAAGLRVIAEPTFDPKKTYGV
ncbi:phosphoribosyl-AMP cyclohydrolase [Botrimarina colliarenosi]|uniref:Phosphoribosyl-AMP cyclohydrolase n=1 Tax=Botrimarina colliarenosi TaxID=2528001 RepID=A0A5C6AIP5_9BACT|nr:phosphoribosyl-AMP cyclohydrolase [Botrimarina colliarenosi]TWT99932.1 phosphoribosyl-AMP cyclohydrolase [Botrimarina colliarenosi]